MLKNLLLAILMLTISSQIFADQFHDRADQYRKKAGEYNKKKIYSQALEWYQKSIAAEKQSRKPRKAFLAYNFYVVARIYALQRQYKQAIDFYNQSLKLYQQLANKNWVMAILYNIAGVYHVQRQYKKSIIYYQKVLTISQEMNKQDQSAILFFNIGEGYLGLRAYEKAISYYKRSLKIYEALKNKPGILFILYRIAYCQLKLLHFKKTVNTYNQVFRLYKEIDNKAGMAAALVKIGTVYNKWSRFKEANVYFQRALKLYRQLKDSNGIALCLNHIATVYQTLGIYDQSITQYKQALAIYRQLKYKRGISAVLNNIGGIYFDWGRYHEALEYYTKALKLSEELGLEKEIVIILNNIGEIYFDLQRYQEAMKYYQRGIQLGSKLGLKSEIAYLINNLGEVASQRQQYNDAMDHYQRSFAIYKEIRNKRGMARLTANMGTIYMAMNQFKQAVAHFQQSYNLYHEVGDLRGSAITLYFIGYGYWRLKDYRKAVPYFHNSINIIEKIRLTAKPAIRRDYLARMMFVYQLLSSSYLKNHQYKRAFNTIELSRAKVLVEQLGKKIKKKSFLFSGVKNYQKTLKSHVCILNYANVNKSDAISQLVVTQKNIYGFELAKRGFLKKLNPALKKDIMAYYRKLKGHKQNQQRKSDFLTSLKTTDDLEKAIHYYRYLLSEPKIKQDGLKQLRLLGQKLYNLLLKPAEKHLADKKQLVIIPDGILGIIPFESLIMPDGRYLIEKYHITYTQSLTVSDLLSKRNYASNRKPMLAFGYAVYDEQNYKQEKDLSLSDQKQKELAALLENEINKEKKFTSVKITSNKEIDYLAKTALVNMDQKKSLRSHYKNLGYHQWPNLHGTLLEVNGIKKIFPKTTLYKGKEVNESQIKKMSQSGELKSYQIIHFAAHGLVVPEIPELSAVVLSQHRRQSNEDGYLTMNEIAELDINADFVNLSACETGLGKIYGGEGVVGLSQAFLIAGANGLSVSLWQVADKFTMKYMIGMYQLVRDKKISYAYAMTQMKRHFINNKTNQGKYSHPFYWAPFVYYGKN